MCDPILYRLIHKFTNLHHLLGITQLFSLRHKNEIICGNVDNTESMSHDLLHKTLQTITLINNYMSKYFRATTLVTRITDEREAKLDAAEADKYVYRYPAAICNKVIYHYVDSVKCTSIRSAYLGRYDKVFPMCLQSQYSILKYWALSIHLKG